MVDPARTRRLLSSLAGYKDRLAALAELPQERYLSEQALAGRYLVQVSAQTCIDVANHVIASDGWRVPGDFRDAFTVLEENDVLDADLAERLRALTGLRNRLVHLYEDVDDARVYEALAAGLVDLDAFARAIAKRVENASD